MAHLVTDLFLLESVYKPLSFGMYCTVDLEDHKLEGNFPYKEWTVLSIESLQIYLSSTICTLVLNIVSTRGMHKIDAGARVSIIYVMPTDSNYLVGEHVVVLQMK